LSDDEKQELIKKLAESRENICLLQNMLKREQSNIENELILIDGAKRNLNDALLGLTGNEFYRNT